MICEHHKTITLLLNTAYYHYFDYRTEDHDKTLAPHICCKSCYNRLTAWFNSKNLPFTFAVPMIWSEPESCADDCHFCLRNINIKMKYFPEKMKYHNFSLSYETCSRLRWFPCP